MASQLIGCCKIYSMQNYHNLKVDLTNCDKEPIHLIGRVQPHGFMLILDRATLGILQVSQNIGQYLQVNAGELPGKSIASFLSEDEHKDMVQLLTDSATVSPHVMVMQQQHFFGFITHSDDKLVLEFEPMALAINGNRLENMLCFSQFHTELNNFATFEQKTDALVTYIQRMLDYDRVMLYVFDQDWHGEVIAEKVKPGVHSYLHHHFPSTDIPAQARELLLHKPVRQIADVNAEAVDIIPYFDPRTGAPTNIIQSELRNPSEIHLQYLRNMQVMATLSVSIIVQGRLWGIIACQHQSAKFINFWKRQTCLFAALTFSNAILANQEKTDQYTMQRYRSIAKNLVKQVDETGSLEKGLFGTDENLLSITEGHGVAVCHENGIATAGNTPTQAQIQEIVDWLTVQDFEQCFATRELSRYISGATAYREEASGLLAIELSKHNKEFILFFKPEIQEKRVWAGNPEKPVQETSSQMHPRKSFEKWVETVRGKSVPWSANDIAIAQVLQKDIIALLMQQQAEKLTELNEGLNALTDDLQLKNKKLEDFAQIIAHNLRSPMSNIKGLYELYKADPSPETRTEVMNRMSKMIKNMSVTVDDLNLVLRSATKQEMSKNKIKLSDIIETEKQNMQATLDSTGGEMVTDLSVPVLLAPKVYIESILHNLLSNALKYRADNRKPVISIKTWADNEKVYLTVADNGLGMDMKKVGKKMFGLYNTFHRNKDSKGIGLYLTQTQVELLGGTIEVESEVNKGTTFILSFPESIAHT